MRQTFSERRNDVRRRSLFGAFIQIAPEASVTECVVRDIGAGGARILLHDAVPLTETFALTIGERREVRRVRLVWRGSGAVGVVFVRPRPPVVPVPLEMMRELQAMKAENAALRLRLADFRQPVDADTHS